MNCKIDGCLSKVKGHGLCNKHLKKYRKYGDPLAGKTYGHSIAMENAREYNSYKSMVNRCSNHNATGFERYGGVGIGVCSSWLGEKGFENFLSDMGPRPENCSLDRINNSLGYSPENCKWSSAKEQNRNRKTNALVEYNGKTQTLVEWSEELGLSYGMLVMRHSKYKWTGDKLFSNPKR